MYGLGDLKFGHLTFIVLTGILVRDIFPDPDVVCQFLKGNQRHAITWFYEWILKTALIQEDLLNVSLEEVIFTAEWAPEVILPDRNPEKLLNSEKVLEPEKEKPAGQRSSCLRSSAPGRSKKKKGTRKRRARTQDMVEDGCLQLGLTRDVINLT